MTTSAFPGRRPVVASLLDPDLLVGSSDEELRATIIDLLDEQRRRALDRAEPEAVADAAFDQAFDSAGKPREPYLVGDLLVCPGGKTTKSRTSHDCVFVAVGDTWVWDASDVLYDDMRQVPGGKWLQTVSLIAAVEGLEIDMVTSRARSGGRCEMTSARSFTVVNGALRETQVRTRQVSGHR